MSIQYNLNFDKVCNILKLGEVKGTPEAVTGGLLHRMYFLETKKGKYAIKALNPQVMLRPEALNNLINSEKIANIAADFVPALPGKIINGISLHEIESQFYIVFDWLDGVSLKFDQINVIHCEKIGAILADIHMIDFTKLKITNNRSKKKQMIDWNYFLQQGRENNAVWVGMLLEFVDKLYDFDRLAIESKEKLADNMVISHRDLEPKNVIWVEDSPIIIDWESAGFINPIIDMIETAIYWSKNKDGNIEKDRFLSFIYSYRKKYGTFNADWKAVLYSGFSSKLGWLEYSLKRSLWIECTDEQEQKMGTKQVTGTINGIKRYSEMLSELEIWLNEVN